MQIPPLEWQPNLQREALVQWRYECLSVEEAVVRLGVSVSTIDRRAREGHIELLQDMGGQQQWFARNDLTRLYRSDASACFSFM